MMRAKGAAIVGKTVTTEFAFFSPGPTVNPHNPAHTPGGSSSGSAAAVAAGMVPVALGTQTGGSVIRPASFCGVAGYKPSFRLVPMVGAKCFSWSLDTAGFFAASVRDVAAFTDAALGRDLKVQRSGEPPRIGLYRSAIDEDASLEMRNAVENAARDLEKAGATIVTIMEPDELALARDVHATIQNFEAGLACADEFARHADRMSPILRETLQAGRAIAPDIYDNARRTARIARKRSHALFDSVDLLLTPSAPGIAPLGLETTGSPVFNKLWTLLGLPCVSVAAFNDQETGLPLGLQCVGRFGRDKALLSAAHWVETALTR